MLMSQYVKDLLAKAPAVHYCAGKLDGAIVALVEATPGHTLGTHQAIVLHDGKLIEMPIQSEAIARAMFHRTVRDLNAASV